MDFHNLFARQRPPFFAKTRQNATMLYLPVSHTMHTPQTYSHNIGS